jgi:phospholipase A2
MRIVANPAAMQARLRQSLVAGKRQLMRGSRRQHQRPFSWSTSAAKKQQQQHSSSVPAALVTGGLLIWWLYPSEDFSHLSDKSRRVGRNQDSLQQQADDDAETKKDEDDEGGILPAWANFSRQFESMSLITDLEWAAFSEKIVDLLPDWAKLVPGYIRKLQRELSMSPGSLAEEIWEEAHDPLVNPEIRYSSEVRVSTQLCNDEKEFLARRKKWTRVALAKYLELKEEDIHPDDIPTIAMCGSGGGLRALIAGTGSMLATEEDGLFDCVTYTAGVSGSCWLQMLYLSSFTRGRISSLLEHLKARASIHIAYPPVAFQSLVNLPTSKYLLSGMVEKLKGDPHADFGLVDIYGLLLAARYLIPKGDLGVSERDFKLSSQREYMKYGQNPLPIYTAVRHEIPEISPESLGASENAKEVAKQEGWFQWYEITPYEFFCEEFNAGIPTWAMGRKYEGGKDVPPEHGFHLPEVRLPLLMGIFGSAFCATLNHYYMEIQPLVRSMAGLEAVDEMISGRSDDLSKVHPIDPAKIPNFAYQMQGKLSPSTPRSIYENEYIQLMDAGMSNNLPIYPLLRPGRDVDVLVVFDASADVKTDNWLSVADGYARQRGIKGWPLGIGWPKSDVPASETAKALDEAQAHTPIEAEQKIEHAQADQAALRKEANKEGEQYRSEKGDAKFQAGNEEAGDLGYCTVWVGTTEERSSEPPPPSKILSGQDSWRLMEPDAGITVAYLPFLANDKVPGVSPGTTDYLSTWNFIYTPEQIEKVVQLARANYDEGREQIRSTVRAVYERKKKHREETQKATRRQKFIDAAQRGEAALVGDGDQFS